MLLFLASTVLIQFDSIRDDGQKDGQTPTRHARDARAHSASETNLATRNHQHRHVVVASRASRGAHGRCVVERSRFTFSALTLTVFQTSRVRTP